MKEIDIIDPLNQDELRQESEIIQQIKQGMEFANKSYFMIIDGLKKIKDLRLYREAGTLRDWALMHFGFGDREYNYYLKAGEVIENIRHTDPDVNLKLTHALAIGMVEPDDQPVLWQKVKGSGKALTKKLIVNIAKDMEIHGELKARDGVNIKPESDSAYLISRIKTSWLTINDDSKPALITEILVSEPDSFLKVVIAAAEQELRKRNEQY